MSPVMEGTTIGTIPRVPHPPDSPAVGGDQQGRELCRERVSPVMEGTTIARLLACLIGRLRVRRPPLAREGAMGTNRGTLIKSVALVLVAMAFGACVDEMLPICSDLGCKYPCPGDQTCFCGHPPQRCIGEPGPSPAKRSLSPGRHARR